MTREVTESPRDNDRGVMGGTTNACADGGIQSDETKGNNSTAGSVKDDDKDLNRTTCHSTLWRKRRYFAYLFFAFVSLGMLVAIHGPTFLDLVAILRVDIETGSVLFTSCSVGYITGSLIGGVMYDRFNKELTLLLSTLFMGAFSALVPWCRTLVLMCIVNACRGIMEGVQDADVNAMIFHIWRKDAGPYMQAVQFAFGFGAIIAPLVAEPFLMKKPEIDGASPGNMPLNSTNPVVPFSTTMSMPNPNLTTTIETLNFSTLELNFTNVNGTTVETDSQIYIPYLILGTFAALTAFPFFEMYWSSRNENKKRERQVGNPEQVDDRHIPLTIGVRAAFFVLMGMFYVSYACVEDTFSGFIMAFVVEHLKWDKTKGTWINSVFWIAFSVGRLLAVAIAKFLSPWKMLMLDFAFFDLGFLALFLGAQSSEIVCWLATGLTALSMGSIFPTCMTWVDEKIFLVTGKVSSFVLVSASVGMMTNPVLVGYLFETYSPIWFIYVLFAETLFCTLSFALMTLLLYRVKKKWNARTTREAREENGPRNMVTNQTLIIESTAM